MVSIPNGLAAAPVDHIVMVRSMLRQIIEAEDLRALEAFCLQRTHQQVREQAIEEGVDLDELEELLGRI